MLALCLESRKSVWMWEAYRVGVRTEETKVNISKYVCSSGILWYQFFEMCWNVEFQYYKYLFWLTCGLILVWVLTVFEEYQVNVIVFMSSADCYSTKFININHLFVFSFILFLFKQTALYNFSVAFNTDLYAFYTQNKLREANKL